MKKTIIILSLFISSISYAQTVEINNKNKNKTFNKIKITLPENYTVYLFVNRKLIKKKRFKGVKFFKLANLSNYRISSTTDKKNKILNVYFKDDLEDAIRDRTIDFETVY